MLALKAAVAQAEGDLPRASTILAPLRPSAGESGPLETQVYQAILERGPAQIIGRLKELLVKPDPGLGYINGELRFWLGWAQEVGGDEAGAQQTWRLARLELEPFLKEQPENYMLIAALALTNMGLGDKVAAMALVDRIAAAMPIEKDALGGPFAIEILARVAARHRRPGPCDCGITESYSPYLTLGHLLQECRSLPHSSGSIQCSIHFATIRVFGNWRTEATALRTINCLRARTVQRCHKRHNVIYALFLVAFSCCSIRRYKYSLIKARRKAARLVYPKLCAYVAGSSGIGLPRNSSKYQCSSWFSVRAVFSRHGFFSPIDSSARSFAIARAINR